MKTPPQDAAATDHATHARVGHARPNPLGEELLRVQLDATRNRIETLAFESLPEEFVGVAGFEGPSERERQSVFTEHDQFAEDVTDLFGVSLFSVRGQPHDLVLVLPGCEAQGERHAGVELAQRSVVPRGSDAINR
jgi:hypothetical protein